MYKKYLFLLFYCIRILGDVKFLLSFNGEVYKETTSKDYSKILNTKEINEIIKKSNTKQELLTNIESSITNGNKNLIEYKKDYIPTGLGIHDKDSYTLEQTKNLILDAEKEKKFLFLYYRKKMEYKILNQDEIFNENSDIIFKDNIKNVNTGNPLNIKEYYENAKIFLNNTKYSLTPMELSLNIISLFDIFIKDKFFDYKDEYSYMTEEESKNIILVPDPRNLITIPTYLYIENKEKQILIPNYFVYHPIYLNNLVEYLENSGIYIDINNFEITGIKDEKLELFSHLEKGFKIKIKNYYIYFKDKKTNEIIYGPEEMESLNDINKKIEEFKKKMNYKKEHKETRFIVFDKIKKENYRIITDDQISDSILVIFDDKDINEKDNIEDNIEDNINDKDINEKDNIEDNINDKDIKKKDNIEENINDKDTTEIKNKTSTTRIGTTRIGTTGIGITKEETKKNTNKLEYRCNSCK